jgi:hypothetical protein
LEERKDSINIVSEELLHPWEEEIQEAEERFDLYEPNFFCDYMNTDYEQAVKDYHTLLEIIQALYGTTRLDDIKYTINN